MKRAAPLLAALVIGPLLAETSVPPGTPRYSQESITNAAANTVGPYAPNTFVSIYGQDLAYGVRAIGPEDIRAGILPTALLGVGVRVLINNLPANMYYASPTQVNVLIPTSLVPGPAKLQLLRDAHAGPAIQLMLGPTAPGLFEHQDRVVIATHGNGPLVTHSAPASPGEVVVLYATGLGLTEPRTEPNRVPTRAAALVDVARFQVLLNGTPVPPNHILYAGVTPGFAGLFQINLLLPAGAPANPEIQVGFPESLSPPGRILPLAATGE